MRHAHRILLVLFLLFASSALLADRARLVTVDVAVTDKSDRPVAGLDPHHFKVFEDNVEQAIVMMGPVAKPLNVVLLIELSDSFNSYEEVIEPAIGLIRSLPPDSWIALVTFGIQQEIAFDFTRDRKALTERLWRLQTPFSREVALYDGLNFALERMKGLPGKNTIFLFSRGEDTISKLGYSAVLKNAQALDSTIYSIGLTEFARPNEGRTAEPGAGIARLQAESVMRAFAEGSGGLYYFPRFSGEYPGIYQTVRADLIYLYRLVYVSANPDDTKFHKLRVDVMKTDVNGDGKLEKLKVRHKKGF